MQFRVKFFCGLLGLMIPTIRNDGTARNCQPCHLYLNLHYPNSCGRPGAPSCLKMAPKQNITIMAVDSDSDISIPDDIEAPRRNKGKGKAKAGDKRKADSQKFKASEVRRGFLSQKCRSQSSILSPASVHMGSNVYPLLGDRSRGRSRQLADFSGRAPG